MKILCPHCNTIIEVPTYYSRNRTKLLNIYKEKMKNPEFAQRRREIALKAYHKNKLKKQNEN